jgi:GntR family transcriptional regulator, transcriptional repressor for pyruvate dehydrogenase complex
MTTQPPVPLSLPLRFHSVARRSIYLDVAGQIRAAILAGTMATGQQLPPERELSRQFAVSRATVREALRHLQAQGLLAPRGRTSPLATAGPEDAVERFREALTHVVKLREVSLPDLVELRLAVETAALERAAAAPVPAELEAARAALAVMERADVPAEEFRGADVAFHVALVGASGNQALLLVMQAVKDGMRLHLGEALRARSFAKARPSIVAEHRALLRAVERGAGRDATALLRRHLRFYAT